MSLAGGRAVRGGLLCSHLVYLLLHTVRNCSFDRVDMKLEPWWGLRAEFIAARYHQEIYLASDKGPARPRRTDQQYFLHRMKKHGESTGDN
jgi:hypothetical protein